MYRDREVVGVSVTGLKVVSSVCVRECLSYTFGVVHHVLQGYVSFVYSRPPS